MEKNEIELKLRPASMDDAELLLSWRNDEATLKASRQTGPVLPDTHLKWLEGVLSDPSRHLFIAEAEGMPLGTIRADEDVNETVLSWTVAPEHRGKGVGKRMLTELLTRFSGRIRADVRPGNTASTRMVQALGFRASGTADGFTTWILSLERSKALEI